jgi:polyhydroxybutyrate depolymerase
MKHDEATMTGKRLWHGAFAGAGVMLALLAACAPAGAQTLRERLEARRAAEAGAQAIEVDGLQRAFHVHVPAGLGNAPGAVLVFHGGGGSGAAMIGQNPTVPAADAGGFVAVFPEGVEGHWNDGRLAMAEGVDDVAFVRALVAWLVEVHGVDPDRVFATGMSNGGMFTYRLACDAPDLVRAIAPVAATMPEALRDVCSPGRGTPVMMFSGTGDGFMPFEGGKPEQAGLMARFRGPVVDSMVSAPDTIAFWAGLNGCGESRSTALPDLADDDTTVTRISWDCGAATLYRIEGGGHTWPGSGVRIAPRLTGATSMDIDATALMVEFFRAYGL